MEGYKPNWESLEAYEVPAWFKDAKLGIFIHWGVYAVPAYGNEWYPRNMYLRSRPEFEHHRETWGPQNEFGYKDFVPLFKAESWDPVAWIQLFQEAGARYVVPVAEHHDGFPMYDCSFTNWNAAQLGPKRDVVAELAQATREAGIRFGVSSHRAHNWRYYTFADDFDTSKPAYHKLYSVPHPADAPVTYEFVLDWYARTKELVERFSPDVLWFDFGWHRDEFEPWRPRVAAYYYNHALTHGYEPVLQYKAGFPDGVAVLDIERGKLNDIRPDYWQTDTSISYKSWGYIENDAFRTVASTVHDLVDIVSKNGNLLLNVGPKPDGTIPYQARDILQGIGQWLAINGEAIYGTRPWSLYGEGPTEVLTARFREQEYAPFTAQDIRFTTRSNALYAISLGWPKETLLIQSLASDNEIPAARIAAIHMLGHEPALEWEQTEKGLRIQVPEEKPSEHAVTFRVTLKP
jgi:alpha-L-fucosidase